MKYIIFAALFVTSFGIADVSNEAPIGTEEEFMPIYYCKKCGEQIFDPIRHEANCTGKK